MLGYRPCAKVAHIGPLIAKLLQRDMPLYSGEGIVARLDQFRVEAGLEATAVPGGWPPSRLLRPHSSAPARAASPRQLARQVEFDRLPYLPAASAITHRAAEAEATHNSHTRMVIGSEHAV